MKLVLDGTKITDREDLHQQMEAVLDFPEWYGGKLDVLHDCLADLMEEVDIHILHANALKAALDDYADKVIEILKDAERVNLNIQIIIE